MSSRRSRKGGKGISTVIQAKVEILAEAAFCHFGIEIGVGRRNQSYAHLACLGRTEPLEFAGLDHAQQLLLLGHRHVGDLVEKQCAAVSQLEAAHALGHATGVHGHHRTPRPRRHRMQRLVGRFALASAPNGSAQFSLRPDDRQQPLVLPRLLHEVTGAAPHRRHGHVDGAPRRHHHHRQRLVTGVNALQQVQAFFAGRGVARVVQIHQDDVVALELERAEDVLGRRCGIDEEPSGFRSSRSASRTSA